MAQATKSRNKPKSVVSKATSKKTKGAKAQQVKLKSSKSASTKDRIKTGTSADTSGAPKGWWFLGHAGKACDYLCGLDSKVFHSGTKSAYIHNPGQCKSETGSLMQSFEPGSYLKKRIRVSFWLKTEHAQKVTAWTRIDGPDGWKSRLAYDDLCGREKIAGSTDWTQYITVLDVPEASTLINFGVTLRGKGKFWLDDVKIETVTKKVPTTDCPCSQYIGKPRNLSFEE